MRMRHMILAVLCIWSCILTVTPLTTEQVARANHYIQQHYTGRYNFQYAYFVKFSEDECNRGLSLSAIQEALSGEDATFMKQIVEEYCIYTGQRIVVSSYRPADNANYNIHSEYRLLDPDNHSPTSILLSRPPAAGCVIFYSYNSPCVKTCLRPGGDYNIIDKILKVQGLPDKRAFAFSEVWKHDKKYLDSWKPLNNIFPLYHCNGNNCAQCFVNGVLQEQCKN